MPAATAAPPSTARLPPSQKSFCTSTTISARLMGVEASPPSAPERQPGQHVADRRVPQPPLVLAGAEVDVDVDAGRRGLVDEAHIAVVELVLGAAPDEQRRQLVS